jgi:hypothetical protein
MVHCILGGRGGASLLDVGSGGKQKKERRLPLVLHPSIAPPRVAVPAPSHSDTSRRTIHM